MTCIPWMPPALSNVIGSTFRNYGPVASATSKVAENKALHARLFFASLSYLQFTIQEPQNHPIPPTSKPTGIHAYRALSARHARIGT